MSRSTHKTWIAAIVFMVASISARGQKADFFNQEVRPILSQHCFKCHGPDDKQRMAGLRLDDPASAYAKLNSGKFSVVPGNVAKSELVKRIHATGPLMMPPASANKPLSAAQMLVLEKWIKGGAGYKTHWAFVAPKQAPLPPVKQTNWVRNPIDRFILSRLESEGMTPSGQADKYTLIRRVSLDLIGLPPTLEETIAFVNDSRPDAYERLVDRLLASPHYGERWARRWLDLARYADTNGFEKDRQRSIWPYRDWVINSMNADMPFNEFTIEQLAGDMLPNATISQRIATGFHRNTMLNEEGGIDPLEYRYYSLVDRTATTGTTWLGLTVGCAQCHTHKFDPITHKEYYQMMAFLDNADEPQIPVTRPDIAQKRKEIEAKAIALERDLPNRFPIARQIKWETVTPTSAKTESGAKLTALTDGSLLASGVVPDKDVYTIQGRVDSVKPTLVRIETLTDPSLGNKGPGRTPHGNFVLTEFGASALTPALSTPIHAIKFASAETDFNQEGFPPGNAIDGNDGTGWAISGPGNWNVNRTITFRIDESAYAASKGAWMFRLAQNYGGQHTIGRFRISVGTEMAVDSRPEAIQRKERFESTYATWLKQAEASAVKWTSLKPTTAKSVVPMLTIEADNSVFSQGDTTKRDVYDVQFNTPLKDVTAIRLEAIPDPRLPEGGSGRIFYEGNAGDFFLSEITAKIDGQAAKFFGATQSVGNASPTLDGNPQTGWSVGGGKTKVQTAIYRFEKPVTANKLAIQMVFEQYYTAPLGRFRISTTSDTRELSATLPPDIEQILTVASASRTDEMNSKLIAHFVSVAPELESERQRIQQVRNQEPSYATTLAFTERPANNPRVTYVHHRGEYLSTEEAVKPGTLAVLPKMPTNIAPNRLSFAKWLVDEKNPLTARVAVNRQWAAFFGKGIVSSTDDFGFQGQPPTHPELLDWLAIEFEKQGWSMKKLHKLIVMSATYRQSSKANSKMAQRDLTNRLLGRGPSVRIEAELVRDLALKASGLMSDKIGGPSVFPPQPAGVTSEGTYGPLAWNTSMGEDRYRRGLYTFSKRTAPYAMFTTFDAPSGEACLARREVSNTPLQALTLLNDVAFLEAAQALGKQMAAQPGTVEKRADTLFRRILTRPPGNDEVAMMTKYYEAQKTRLAKGELKAMAIAGPGDGSAEERAAWTTLARTLLNLDETITKR